MRLNSLLSSFPVLSEFIVLHQAVSGKRIRRTLLPSVRSDPLLVFGAVKKMAPSSREAIGQEVPDESHSRLPRHVGLVCHE